MKEIRFEKTSIIAIYGKNGRSKEGTTSRVDTKLQNQLNKMYIQNLSDNVVDGRYSRGLFDVFRKSMVEAS
jgi:hypothetical protein